MIGTEGLLVLDDVVVDVLVESVEEENNSLKKGERMVLCYVLINNQTTKQHLHTNTEKIKCD